MALGNNSPFSHEYLQRMWIMAILLILASTLLIQCGETPPEPVRTPEKLVDVVSYDGYEIHLFPTAQEQLRYALSRFSDPFERRAALKVVVERFSDVGPVRAEAELEMAYLKLGVDHRFADAKMCLEALADYRRIIASFPELPDICVKAHWYMGWILTDLLNRKKEGIEHHQTVYRYYPDARVKMESPVTWVVLVMPEIKSNAQASTKKKALYWASLALLEIVRKSVREEERLEAFQALWAGYRESLATGYALCVLLKGPTSSSSKVVNCAKEYLEKQKPVQPLADEICKLLYDKNPGVK